MHDCECQLQCPGKPWLVDEMYQRLIYVDSPLHLPLLKIAPMDYMRIENTVTILLILGLRLAFWWSILSPLISNSCTSQRIGWVLSWTTLAASRSVDGAIAHDHIGLHHVHSQHIWRHAVLDLSPGFRACPLMSLPYAYCFQSTERFYYPSIAAPAHNIAVWQPWKNGFASFGLYGFNLSHRQFAWGPSLFLKQTSFISRHFRIMQLLCRTFSAIVWTRFRPAHGEVPGHIREWRNVSTIVRKWCRNIGLGW